MAFTRAIVRRPTVNFGDGLTSAGEGAPDFEKALQQHEDYCDALRRCGLQLTHLAPDAAFPDATFVEDTAIVTGRGAVLTHPGAPSRRGEVTSVALALNEIYDDLPRIQAPGTVDGGDICEAGDHFLIGVSARTNESGAAQLAGHLRRLGYSASLADIRNIKGLLHLKTGIAWLGDAVWLVDEAIVESVRGWSGLQIDRIIAVGPEESYAANCVRVNDAVLVAQGYPRVSKALEDLGLRTVILDMSEFRKMDGGLSCLSLRF
jgi:dimethylargininase